MLSPLQMGLLLSKKDHRAGDWRRVISKNSGRQTFVQKLRHDKPIQPTILQSSRRFLLNSFSERSAMALRYTVATTKAPNPTDKHAAAASLSSVMNSRRLSSR
jgi:hypothetical protein